MTQRPDFAAFGRRGARIRLRRLPPELRSEIARRAARAKNEGMTSAERSKAARKAVLVRWAKAKKIKAKKSKLPAAGPK